MLKIKDNVDLKELEKFGFKKDKNDNDNIYYLDFKPYEAHTDYSYIEINGEDRLFNIDCVEVDDYEKVLNVLFDLIQAGLVEKVEV